MQSYWPTTIYVSDEARDDAMTERLLSKLPDAKVIDFSERGDPLAASVGRGFVDSKNLLGESSDVFTLGKRTLLLRRYFGEWLEPCPGTKQHVCCNLWTLNPGEGCPLDCTYCFLQSYLRLNPSMKIYTNIGDMLGQVERRVRDFRGRNIRICTGEVMDSLVWDELTDLTLDLVPFFARLPSATLELKTKTASIGNLLKLANEHKGKTIVSWSVNARRITENDEAFTASLGERILAAKKIADAGYKVGFHFDPLIYFEGFKDAYREVISEIFQYIRWQDIAWISIAPLRYKRDMQEIMMRRFPDSKIPFGEQFLASDGKLRYIQPLRFQMLDFVWRELKSINANLPVYMCMESSLAWKKIAGSPPAVKQELKELFSAKSAEELCTLGAVGSK